MIYGLNIKYKDDLELMSKAVQVYSTVVNINTSKNFLRPRLVQVLSYYLIYGLTDETKVLVQEALGITKDNINQINCDLQKKGFLKQSAGNYRKKVLSDGILEFKKFFDINKGDTVDYSKRLMGIKFEHEG